MVSLQFILNIEEDWPPVGSESLQFRKLTFGYECLSVPIFIKDLSVGDVINVEINGSGFVSSWTHFARSKRSTIWLLRIATNDQIEPCLERLRFLGCNTTSVVEFGCYAIDVPKNLSISDVDQVLESLDPSSVAVAFPSMRHSE